MLQARATQTKRRQDVEASSTSLGLQQYRLPPLLPIDQSLVLHPTGGMLSLLQNGSDQPALLLQCQLSLSATLVLRRLLLCYPDWCPFEDLLVALYPQQTQQQFRQRLDEARGHEWTLLVKPVQRAIERVDRTLRPCGLGVVSLRRQGYQLIIR